MFSKLEGLVGNLVWRRNGGGELQLGFFTKTEIVKKPS